MLETELRKDSAFFDFTKPAEALLGDSIATNIMMLGFAYQRGLLPLSAESIQQAIEVNGVSIKMNTQAFQLGRLAAARSGAARCDDEGQDDDAAPVKSLDAMSLDEIITHRMGLLTDYQNGRLARRYRKLVDQVRDAAIKGGYGEALPRAVAINYAKLLAYKDEYEVARLFTDGRFEKQLRDQFEGDFKFNFNLAPPILGGGLDAQGRPKKRAFGSWMMSALQGDGAVPLPARNAARHLRLQRRPQARARPDRGLREGCGHRVEPAVAAQSRHRGRIAVAARAHPRLRPGEGEGGQRRQGSLHATRRRPRQPAAGAAADGGGE